MKLKTVIITLVALFIIILGVFGFVIPQKTLFSPEGWISVHSFVITSTDTSRFQFPNSQAGAYTFTNFTASDTLYVGDSGVNKNTGFPILPNQSMTVNPSVNTSLLYGKWAIGTSGNLRGINFK